MVGARQDQEIKVLVFIDQSVDQTDRLRHGNIVIHCTVHDIQMTLQVLCQCGIVALQVDLLVVQTVICFGPLVVVHALVMVAGR